MTLSWPRQDGASGANPTTQTHSLHSATDRDWLTLDVVDDTGSLIISVEPITNGVGIENVDFVLYDAVLLEVARADGLFGNSTANIAVTPYSTGTHYLEVYAPDGSTGDYKVSWDRF